MQDDQVEALKQFIDGRISQLDSRVDKQFSALHAEIKGVRRDLEKFRNETRTNFLGVAEAVTEINDRIDGRYAH